MTKEVPRQYPKGVSAEDIEAQARTASNIATTFVVIQLIA